MPSRFLNVLTVSLSTVGSRLLGLFRDILVFSIFGSSLLNSAFILANTFPNLFRRLLGEGALTAALLPLLTEEKEKHGKERLFWLYNKILSRVMTLLFALVAIVSFLMIVVGQFPGISQRWDLALLLGVLLFPYMALICLAATFAAALNALQRFAIPALTAVWLNLSITLFLGGLGYFATEVPLYRMYWLCFGVLVGGIFQLMIPWMALRREGWRFELDFKPSKEVKDFGRLLLPGILGASVIQINILVSRSLAHFIDESAVS
ncbi:MAG: lipid II flippase MurJ, partial [Opitutales bacterium]|nr:lipid II flippase MurJ [Opitutales bacterium]